MYPLLALLPNIRQSWKNFLIGNTLAYFASPLVMKKKCFITLAPGVLVVKLFSVLLTEEKNKLEYFLQASIILARTEIS
jgi:hypothetical protein